MTSENYNLSSEGWMAGFKEWLLDLGLVSLYNEIKPAITLREVMEYYPGQNKIVAELWKVHMAGIGGGDAISNEDWEQQKRYIRSDFEYWDKFVESEQ